MDCGTFELGDVVLQRGATLRRAGLRDLRHAERRQAQPDRLPSLVLATRGLRAVGSVHAGWGLPQPSCELPAMPSSRQNGDIGANPVSKGDFEKAPGAISARAVP